MRKKLKQSEAVTILDNVELRFLIRKIICRKNWQSYLHFKIPNLVNYRHHEKKIYVEFAICGIKASCNNCSNKNKEKKTRRRENGKAGINMYKLLGYYLLLSICYQATREKKKEPF